MNVVIQPKRIAQILALGAFSLALLSIVGQAVRYFLGKENFFGLVGLFNVNYESNIPTLYSAFILFLCSILLFLVALAKQKSRDSFTNHWRALSVIFLYLSFDELIEIHESVNRNLDKGLQLWESGPWDILNSVILPIFVLAYIKFFRRLPLKTQRLFFLSGSLFTLGAIGIELVGGRYFSNIYNQPIFIAEIIATIEELLEMIGATIFVYAILSYMSSFLDRINIGIGNSPSPVAKELAGKCGGESSTAEHID
ncbi:hypothetical protein [Leptolyngbya sp. FACHB-261]|uniref:hypothetical protein n=1 Tax=Leptolyngbya sp. FACHB-261 TaxID=2692806 RepID=UPI001685A670|nr:hypothetical protein [Leptolyngbya sp. FACHB-261]